MFKKVKISSLNVGDKFRCSEFDGATVFTKKSICHVSCNERIEKGCFGLSENGTTIVALNDDTFVYLKLETEKLFSLNIGSKFRLTANGPVYTKYQRRDCYTYFAVNNSKYEVLCLSDTTMVLPVKRNQKLENIGI